MVESLRQAHKVCIFCRLFVLESFTFVMSESGHEFVHCPVKVILYHLMHLLSFSDNLYLSFKLFALMLIL